MGITKWISDFVSKEVTGDLLSGLKNKISETIEETQERVEKITKYVIKSLSLLLIFFIGLIFLLVGLAQILEDKLPALTKGTGLLLIGGIMILLTIIVKALK